jgi:hypothetical protein
VVPGNRPKQQHHAKAIRILVTGQGDEDDAKIDMGYSESRGGVCSPAVILKERLYSGKCAKAK